MGFIATGLQSLVSKKKKKSQGEEAEKLENLSMHLMEILPTKFYTDFLMLLYKILSKDKRSIHKTASLSFWYCHLLSSIMAKKKLSKNLRGWCWSHSISILMCVAFKKRGQHRSFSAMVWPSPHFNLIQIIRVGKISKTATISWRWKSNKWSRLY